MRGDRILRSTSSASNSEKISTQQQAVGDEESALGGIDGGDKPEIESVVDSNSGSNSRRRIKKGKRSTSTEPVAEE